MNPVQEIELQYRCGYCRAEPGVWCVTWKGSPSSDLHASRYHQAVAAGQLPLSQ